LATLNRVVAPCSKLAFSEWWDTTAGERVVGQLSPVALDHRRFWDAMDMISPTQLIEIERRIVRRMVEVYEVDVSGLALDMTNFATFIDSSNDRAPIAQRGKAKQKRNDLRLVGLGLVVCVDGGIPLVSHAYEGNRHDSSQFADVVGELVERFGSIGHAEDGLTVVFDAGQNSVDNLEFLEGAPLHFIGSLPPSDHLDLMAVPKSRYEVLEPERFEGLSAFESTKVVFGHERRIVVTFSQNFFDKQAAGFEQTLAKARRQLRDVAARLARGAGRKSADQVEAEIEEILAPRWLRRVISVTLYGTEPSELSLTWRADARAKAALADELFGKRVIFTDRDEWSVGDVVAGYRSQSEAEADFRQMKDRRVVSFSPMFHWSDQKIRVHVVYCVLALMVARLMRRETERAGWPMGVRALLSSLAGIEETLLLYQGERGRPRARRMLTEMDPTQERLYDLFGLDAYAPTR
jgi:transposase